ncbi:Panacea domain-containing protein [uncultured Methanobrevibacter sp.]|uniref:Panacea domain-containing protein n=1 Tax=uncultured Methanobrevibacter sp. TaxID=253161 RepID=UPI0025CD706E|nr:Panacea domain-containing protein [uncultured Methanobrevibacter sp.]
MDFMEEKFKMVLHYIIYKCGFKNTVGRTVLHKLLYFSDFNHYELYNESITNESYRKMERGPVPIHFEEAISQLVDEGKVRLGKRKLPCGKTMNRYFAVEAPEIELNQDELDVIDQVIKYLSHMNGKQIGEYALADEPVKRTDEEEIVEYDLVQTRESKEKSKVYVKII